MDGKKIGLLVIVLLMTVGFGVAGKWAYQNDKLPGGYGQSEEEKTTKNTERIVALVSKHLALPDEQPLVARVTDAETLVKEQPFYTGSTNGTYLLLFPNAKKAVLYDPEKDILLNVGPFQVTPDLSVPEGTVPVEAVADASTDASADADAVVAPEVVAETAPVTP